MQACYRWSCSSLYRVWRPFGACTCVIELTEWIGLDKHTGHSSESTLFRKCTFGAIRASYSQAAHAAKAGLHQCPSGREAVSESALAAAHIISTYPASPHMGLRISLPTLASVRHVHMRHPAR